ncbi:LuxR family transcriptional regulator [Paenibacillus darwinianus]|nr:LuxR family transcriptional regulator [Paenibacillus darwinianus]
MIVFLPIHRESLPLLQRYPCSRSYFAALTAEKLKALDTPSNAPAGWFLYHIDMIGDSSPPARQHFFEMFMKLFIRSGLFVISSPIDYIIQVNKELGFCEVPEAGHADLGPDLWSTTLEIDLRGDRLNAYIQNMVNAVGVKLGSVIPEGMYDLSDREREVAQMLMECDTNAAIAKKLHITEITVKKHLSQVYKKAEVKNRTEFVKKLMSID